MLTKQQERIQERVKMEAEFIIKNNATIRQTAKVSGVSKSTVHKDVTIRLKDISYSLFTKVRKVLDKNLAERASRGGKAVHRKYFESNKSKLKGDTSI